MKILVLQGSPNANGSTALLAREFAAGAREAGHDVDIVDVASLDVAPCTGCVACGYGGPCALYDDFDALEAHYDTLVRYLNLRDCGRVLGGGCGTPGMTKRSGYPEQARTLGTSL